MLKLEHYVVLPTGERPACSYSIYLIPCIGRTALDGGRRMTGYATVGDRTDVPVEIPKRLAVPHN